MDCCRLRKCSFRRIIRERSTTESERNESSLFLSTQSQALMLSRKQILTVLPLVPNANEVQFVRTREASSANLEDAKYGQISFRELFSLPKYRQWDKTWRNASQGEGAMCDVTQKSRILSHAFIKQFRKYRGQSYRTLLEDYEAEVDRFVRFFELDGKSTSSVLTATYMHADQSPDRCLNILQFS